MRADWSLTEPRCGPSITVSQQPDPDISGHPVSTTSPLYTLQPSHTETVVPEVCQVISGGGGGGEGAVLLGRKHRKDSSSESN